MKRLLFLCLITFSFSGIIAQKSDSQSIKPDVVISTNQDPFILGYKNQLLYLINGDGSVLSHDPVPYSAVFPFKNGFVVRRNDKMQVIDRNFNSIFSSGYDKIEIVDDHNFIVEMHHYVGMVDDKGKMVIPINYQLLRPVAGLKDAFFVQRGNRLGVLSKDNELLIPYTFDAMSNLGENGFSGFVVSLNGKYGAVDYQGNILLPIQYDQIKWVAEGKFFQVVQKGKQGIVSLDRKIIIPSNCDFLLPVFQKASSTDSLSGKILALQNTKWNCYLLTGDTMKANLSCEEISREGLNCQNPVLPNDYFVLTDMVNVCNTDVHSPNYIYNFCNEMPVYPSGMKGLYHFIYSHINVPAGQHAGQANAVVEFVVEKNGKISNIAIVNNSVPTINDEIVRVIKLLDPFKPAKNNNVLVRCKIQLPLFIKIN